MSALTQLGPYRVVRLIGRGGMGEVYEAVHTGLDKRVALKVLPREMAAARRERFLREARLAAGLHHTNIVPVFDVGVADGLPYYAMQFIPGRPLGGSGALPSVPGTHTFDPDRTTDVTPGSGSSERVPKLEACRLILQAADGLAHAHDRGIVHRDVKPANLLVDDSGVVWVADFGLAFHEQDESLTADGAVLGTPRYMSPEQARADKRIDARTDVFSLGVTLYELLTGRPAFAAESVPALLRQVQEASPPSPRSLDRGIPKDLDTLVSKAMAKRPADRYAHAGELAADLRRYLAGEPVRARRIGAVGKAWRWAKRKPTVATLLGLVLLVFAAGAGASLYFGAQALDRERDALKSKGDLEVTVRTLTEREEDVRRLGYTLRMTLASAAYQGKGFARAKELLAEAADDENYWEWRALRRELNPEPARRAALPEANKATLAHFGPDGLIYNNNTGSYDAGRGYHGAFQFFDPLTFAPTGRTEYRMPPAVGGWAHIGEMRPHYEVLADFDPEVGHTPTGVRRYRLLHRCTGREVVIDRPPGHRFDGSPRLPAGADGRFAVVSLRPDGWSGRLLRAFDLAGGRWAGTLDTSEVLSDTAYAVGRDGEWYAAGGKDWLFGWRLSDPDPAIRPRVRKHADRYAPVRLRVGAGGRLVGRARDGLVYTLSLADPAPPRDLAVGPAGTGGGFHLTADDQTAVVVPASGEVMTVPLDPARRPSLTRLARSTDDAVFVRPDGGRLVEPADGEVFEWDLTRPAARQVLPATERRAGTTNDFYNAGYMAVAGNRLVYLVTDPPSGGPSPDEPDSKPLELVVRDLAAAGQPARRRKLPDGFVGWADQLFLSADGRSAAVPVLRSPAADSFGGLLGGAGAVAAGGWDEDFNRALAVYDLDADAPPAIVPTPHTYSCNGFTPDGRFLVVRAGNVLRLYDRRDRVWRERGLRPRQNWMRLEAVPGPDGTVLTFDNPMEKKDDAGGQVVAVRAADGTVERDFTVQGGGEITAVAYLPETRQVVADVKAGDDNHALWVWDWTGPTAPRSAPLGRPVNHDFHDRPLVRVAAGRAFAAAEGWVRVFTLPDWTPAGDLAGDGGAVAFLAPVPNEDRLLVVTVRDEDATLTVWDTARRQLITSFPLGKLVDGCKHFDFDGHTFRWLRKGYGEDVWLDSLDGR